MGRDQIELPDALLSMASQAKELFFFAQTGIGYIHMYVYIFLYYILRTQV